jgi:hypothetical protein
MHTASAFLGLPLFLLVCLLGNMGPTKYTMFQIAISEPGLLVHSILQAQPDTKWCVPFCLTNGA